MALWRVSTRLSEISSLARVASRPAAFAFAPGALPAAGEGREHGRRAGDDEKFEIVTSLWDQYIADEWDDASEKMHLRFFKHLGYTVVARSKNRKLHH